MIASAKPEIATAALGGRSGVALAAGARARERHRRRPGDPRGGARISRAHHARRAVRLRRAARAARGSGSAHAARDRAAARESTRRGSPGRNRRRARRSLARGAVLGRVGAGVARRRRDRRRAADAARRSRARHRVCASRHLGQRRQAHAGAADGGAPTPRMLGSGITRSGSSACPRTRRSARASCARPMPTRSAATGGWPSGFSSCSKIPASSGASKRRCCWGAAVRAPMRSKCSRTSAIASRPGCWS